MSDNRSSSGVGFVGLLQIAFIVLKLTHVIDWEWWIVLLPGIIEGSAVLVLLAFVIASKVDERRKEIKAEREYQERRERYLRRKEES